MRALYLASCLAFPTLAMAASPTTVPFFPDSQYQNDVVSIEQRLGHALGERISAPAEILNYFETLASSYPERIKLVKYGESWQGRPLFYAVIGSADNLAKLDRLESDMRRLADPRNLNKASADALINSLPASVWLAGGVHGNEISPPEALMGLAYHLLADQSAQTQAILTNTLVYIEPMQNPDGRNRFVSRYYATVGIAHSADRFSAEQNEPWPNGRTNHYLFDMNRDWISLTQPEIKNQVRVLQQMFPLIFVDSHEMGGDQSFYFSPEAEPYNPLVTGAQRESLDWLGQNNAKWFDQLGYDYFTREIFDAMYPGYGASWPLYYGGIATTYEMGSARGHNYRRTDGSILTYADGVQRNFIAYMSTLETASKRAKDLLQRFYSYRQTSLTQGEKDGIRSYIFPATRDAAGHQKLMGVLTQHGITVNQATADFRACGNSYQQGAYVVNAAQPTYQLIRNLLDDDVKMAEAFIARQQDRRSKNLPDEIYDVTAWSLPLMYNLEVNRCNRAVDVANTIVGPETTLAGKVTNTDASYGFIVPWGDMAAARLLSHALQQGLTVKSSDLPFTHSNGVRYPAGSLILSHADNPQLATKIQQLAQSSGAHVTGINSSWIKDGPNFGSGNVQNIPNARVALLWDEPANPLSAGSARFVLEKGIDYPVTAIRPAQLLRAELRHYDVLILPASQGNYNQALGAQAQQKIHDFVSRGGVLVALGNATDWLIQGDKPLLNSKREFKVSEQKKPEAEAQVAGMLLENRELYQQRLEAFQAQPDSVSGFLARAEVDQDHWLTAGVPANVNSIFVGNYIYQPLTLAHGRNVLTFASPEKLVAGGFVWEENRQQIAHKPLLMVQAQGRGQVIAFTQEPNFRAYVDGMHLLYINAVFRGAAHATPLR
ncbi:M14 family zinc carboxypeptidase [Alishewanella sp. SMS8]|uniref:M14 family zinc carboxypeptidase n=1 Tax=unclassified Alishewanella TaxID=2628974 RepID=UPI00274082E3|nr:M14 family zinc carboxypeptidase [Alishewanella sp. SMS8]MDP5034965.1 M14 family zinc carboxypeptidase [Alishewanella sp.]MDP5459023.1 M14 family zinc carboxypeptidase [Alishewanella sp. SMS8]